MAKLLKMCFKRAQFACNEIFFFLIFVSVSIPSGRSEFVKCFGEKEKKNLGAVMQRVVVNQCRIFRYVQTRKRYWEKS